MKTDRGSEGYTSVSIDDVHHCLKAVREKVYESRSVSRVGVDIPRPEKRRRRWRIIDKELTFVVSSPLS